MIIENSSSTSIIRKNEIVFAFTYNCIFNLANSKRRVKSFPRSFILLYNIAVVCRYTMKYISPLFHSERCNLQRDPISIKSLKVWLRGSHLRLYSCISCALNPSTVYNICQKSDLPRIFIIREHKRYYSAPRALLVLMTPLPLPSNSKCEASRRVKRISVHVRHHTPALLQPALIFYKNSAGGVGKVHFVLNTTGKFSEAWLVPARCDSVRTVPYRIQVFNRQKRFP